MSAPQVASAVTVRAPAKVNLYLRVGPLRADGYHELATVFQAVELRDTLLASPAAELTLELEGESADAVPTGPENLAWRAVTALAEAVGKRPHVALRLRKAIPVAGGMAGGSADAAAALLACARLWGVPPEDPRLAQVAAKLGSDVPFALLGGVAVGTGRGERLVPVPAAGRYWWAFAVSDFGISTPAAYRELDRLRAQGAAPQADSSDLSEALRVPAEPLRVPAELPVTLAAGSPAELAELLHNDLQAAALSLRPVLGELLRAGHRLGALRGIVSGSGPTCAFLCADERDAAAVASGVVGAGLCRSAVVAAAPVPGPRALRATSG